ncbi:hypothetical protein N9937_02400 [bacterium]|nr:hypothetical protein [bacterium]
MTDATSITQELTTIIEAQENRRSTGKLISNTLMAVVLGVTMFIGNTVWDNSLAISSMQTTLLGMHTGDRFTGTEGVVLKKRVTVVEHDLNAHKKLMDLTLRKVDKGLVADSYADRTKWIEHTADHRLIDPKAMAKGIRSNRAEIRRVRDDVNYLQKRK